MLTLQIKKKWFDMILSGEKKEEYREIKPYYITRFRKLFRYEYYFNEGKDLNEKRYSTDKKEIIFIMDITRNLRILSLFAPCQSERARKNGERRKEKSILF